MSGWGNPYPGYNYYGQNPQYNQNNYAQPNYNNNNFYPQQPNYPYVPQPGYNQNQPGFNQNQPGYLPNQQSQGIPGYSQNHGPQSLPGYSLNQAKYVERPYQSEPGLSFPQGVNNYSQPDIPYNGYTQNQPTSTPPVHSSSQNQLGYSPQNQIGSANVSEYPQSQLPSVQPILTPQTQISNIQTPSHSFSQPVPHNPTLPQNQIGISHDQPPQFHNHAQNRDISRYQIPQPLQNQNQNQPVVPSSYPAIKSPGQNYGYEVKPNHDPNYSDVLNKFKEMPLPSSESTIPPIPTNLKREPSFNNSEVLKRQPSSNKPYLIPTNFQKESLTKPPPRPSAPTPDLPSYLNKPISDNQGAIRPSRPSNSIEQLKIRESRKSRCVDSKQIIQALQDRDTIFKKSKDILQAKIIYQKQLTEKILNATPQQREAEIQQLFVKFDRDHNALISRGELSSAMKAWGILVNSEAVDLLLYSFSQKNQTNDLSFQEFSRLIIFLLQLKNAFDLSDKNSNGFIDKLELSSVFNIMKINLNEQTKQKLIQFFEKDFTGELSFQELSTMMLYLEDLQQRYNVPNYVVNQSELQAILRNLGKPVSVTEAKMYLERRADLLTKKITFDELVGLFVGIKDELKSIRENIRQQRIRERIKEITEKNNKVNQPILVPNNNRRRRVTMQLAATPIPSTISDPQYVDNEINQIISVLNTTGKFYEDPIFPASMQSIYVRDSSLARNVVGWKRPSEIHPNAQLFVDGVSQGDVIQGDLGNCWFMSALLVLAAHGNDSVKNLFVSSRPEFGFYQVKFFKDGEWITVVVDDRIPVGSNGQPVFARCKDPSEFWVPIIEKAYAKLHGNYEVIGTGSVLSYALMDLTGEAAEQTEIEPFNNELWQTLLRNKREGFLMGCSQLEKGAGEEETPLGILKNHAYGILDIVEEYGLLCIRNPWGEVEWKGRWSDHSREWTPQILQKIGYQFECDGVFYMCFEDWCNNFNRLHTLRLLTDNIGEVWKKHEIKGEWTVNTSGGCINHATFTKNPQYSIVPVVDTPLFMSLHQQDKRYKFQDKSPYPSIGMVLLNKEKDDDYRIQTTDPEQVYKCSLFAPSRESSLEITLKAGKNYVLVPCTFDPNVVTAFFIQIYSRSPIICKPLIKETQSTEIKGTWFGKTSGGCPPNYNTWRDNPQYILTVPKKSDVPFILQQYPHKSGLIHMGMYIWKAPNTDIRRNLNSHDPVWISKLINSAQISESVNLEQGRYILMLTPFNAKSEADYCLKILNPDIHIENVPEWKEARVTSEWRAGLSGGCANHNTWLYNPKFLIKFPSKTNAHLILNANDEIPIGYYLYDKTIQNCIYKSKFVTTNSLHNNITLEAGEYILIACTFEPNMYKQFELVIYSENDVFIHSS